jgi:hypothetical protein
MAWVEYSRLQVNAILQVGDIGALDEESVPDTVTREIAERDPGELGFLDYLRGSSAADPFLGEGGAFDEVPLYFVDGNHDDVRVIDSLRTGTARMHYGNIRYLPSAHVVTITNNAQSVSLAGLGWHHREREVSCAGACL